jgi:hypothetical protein
MVKSNSNKIKDMGGAVSPRTSPALSPPAPSVSFLRPDSLSPPDSLTELIQTICKEAERPFNSYSADVIFAINTVTGLGVDDPLIIEAVKQHRLEILKELGRSLDRIRKRNKKEFLTEYFDRPIDDGNRRVSPRKTLKAYFPGDFENGKNPLPSRKVTFIQNDEPDDQESFSEENDLLCLKILNFSSEIRNKINKVGGKGTVDILKLLIKYHPVHISDKIISKTTGIPIRTIKRRRAWLKGNIEWIDSLIKESKMNFGTFLGVSIP